MEQQMTISMPDSIYVEDLISGYPAYLGYVDGDYITVPGLRAKFPEAKIVSLTVTGRTLEADGCDVESGDLNPDSGAAWVSRKLETKVPGERPIIYASVGIMADVLGALKILGIERNQVRLLSAHYDRGRHVCGPATCSSISIPVDGTQWTDTFAIGLTDVDMSLLENDFFGTAGQTETERIVKELGIVRLGDQGAAVKTVQGLCNARLDDGLEIDGVFGPVTEAEVKRVQQNTGINDDGIVGPVTWASLLAVSG
jgi:hypothetical protein